MHYYKLGEIPHKRHTIFRQPSGELYAEELISTEGFSSLCSLVYHCYPPTRVKEVKGSQNVAPKIAEHKHLKHRSFQTFQTKPHEDFLESRTPLLVNNDLLIGSAAPTKSFTEYFYKNSDADEMLFIHQGKGKLKTMFGNVSFEESDYVIIPRGTIYQLEFETSDNRILYVESYSPIETPKRYRNEYGQLLEHSPFCERDIRKPEELETHKEEGDFLVKIKKEHILYDYVLANHPFDLIGWDGYLFPYAFSFKDFEPITGRIHQPPPVHQTFEAHNYVICSFAPRLYDYHPQAIPAPYNHSNVDSDEVLYYFDGDFMSRKHVDKGQITLHPGGIPHGPHPGMAEKSIGKKETNESAVMIDTFRPLKVTEDAIKMEEPDYHKSWLE